MNRALSKAFGQCLFAYRIFRIKIFKCIFKGNSIIADKSKQRHPFCVHGHHDQGDTLRRTVGIQVPAVAARGLYPTGIKQYHWRVNNGIDIVDTGGPDIVSGNKLRKYRLNQIQKFRCPIGRQRCNRQHLHPR